MRSTPANEIDLDIDPALRSIGDYTSLRRRAPRTSSSSVDVGSKVIVGLRGGGRVEGIVARRIEHGVVLRCEGAADVVVLESARSVTRVLSRD